jgi:hypothetical protein
MKNHTPTYKASNASQTLQDTPKPEYNTAPKALWIQTSKTQRSQQHKTNMERHRSLKRTLLQAEIQKTSERQLFTYSGSKQNRKEIPKVLPSANMRKRISNIHESTRRFNVAARKNSQRTLSLYDSNEPQPRVAIRNCTDHMIQDPFEEHEHAKVEF